MENLPPELFTITFIWIIGWLFSCGIQHHVNNLDESKRDVEIRGITIGEKILAHTIIFGELLILWPFRLGYIFSSTSHLIMLGLYNIQKKTDDT